MNSTAGIFLKATGRRKQSKQHKHILQNKPILHVTLNTNAGARGWSSGHVRHGIPSPRRPSQDRALATHCSGHRLQRDTGARSPCLATCWSQLSVLGATRAPGSSSQAWAQERSPLAGVRRRFPLLGCALVSSEFHFQFPLFLAK